jgi:penicillin amidase
MKRALRFVLWLALAAAAIVVAYAIFCALGMRAAAQTSGTLRGLGVSQPVTILRDWRDVPHIVARNEHDLFFAEGFVEGSDRLFQMDVTRRAVEGRLAEVFGGSALRADEDARAVPVDAIVTRQWTRLSPQLQGDLRAFADGVNAAMRTQPLPVEFRILLYKPQPWRPQDSLVTSFAIVLELTDTWNDVAERQGRPQPLTDPCYDAPVLGGLGAISQKPHCLPDVSALRRDAAAGSNSWAAGAAHTVTGRALLANDPHLPPSVPGIWYLVDLRAPGYHVAGVTIAGIPGVLLGHNDAIAWGATNGSTASLSVFDPPSHLNWRAWRDEAFAVRFGSVVHKRYYRGRDVFGTGVEIGARHTPRFVLVRWDAYVDPISPFATFDSLDRARSIAEARLALRHYPGPTQNFVLADIEGRAAYQLAGDIPNDPAWGRYIHPSLDLRKRYPAVPFDRLPRIAAGRSAIVWTANNKMYASDYPYRLSPEFSPPYRAYRIAQLLKARTSYDAGYFAGMQMDTLSLPERDLAREAGLRSWNGRFEPNSLGATRVYDLRRHLIKGTQAVSELMIRLRSGRPRSAALEPLAGPAPTNDWGSEGSLTMLHPLSALGLSFLDGTTFPGDGDAFTIHVQTPSLSQSFRAVWDVGNWDAGGISLPQGESGEPGSGHYTDEAPDWLDGKLLPLPYSAAAVEASALKRLTLLP